MKVCHVTFLLRTANMIPQFYMQPKKLFSIYQQKSLDHLLYRCVYICHLYVDIHLHQSTYRLQSIPFQLGRCANFSKIFKMGYAVSIKPQAKGILIDASDTPFRNFKV